MNPIVREQYWSMDRVFLLAVLAVSAALGVVAVLTIPDGLPYDEPAHWGNALYIAREHKLPVLGEPGVGYEGHQAPLYYVFAALIASAPLPPETSFAVVRLFGLVGHVLMTWLVFALLREAVPDLRAVVYLGTVFIGLNPMLLVMAGSVQNDSWSLALGFAAMAATLYRSGSAGMLQPVSAGVLGALAVLTKLSMAPVLIGIAIYYLARREVRRATVMSVSAVAVMGWWFIRNVRLYGDLTGQGAVGKTGTVFEEGASLGPLAITRSVLTYMSLPTEYLRNVIVSPGWLDVVAVTLGVLAVAGALWLAAHYRSHAEQLPLVLVASTGLVAVAVWLNEVIFGWPVGFRLAFAALPLIALCVGSATQLLTPRAKWFVPALVIGSLFAIGIWTLHTLLSQDIGGYPLPVL